MGGAGGISPYRGKDRRTRHSRTAREPTLGELLQAAGVAAAGVLVGLGLLVHGRDWSLLAGTFEVLSGFAFVAAGGALFVAWKISGRASDGWLGTALADLGLLSVAYHSLAGIGVGTRSGLEMWGHLVITVIVAALIVGATRSPDVDSGFRPVRLFGVSALIGLAGLELLEVTVGGADALLPTRTAVAAAAVAVWVATGILVVAQLRRRQTPARSWVAVLVAIQAVTAVVSAGLMGWSNHAVAFQGGTFLAAVFAVVSAVWELRSTVKGQDRYALDLRNGLEEMSAAMRRERAELEERLHDLRNAVSAMRTADSTLRRYSAQLDEPTRRRLADALSAELSRLQHLIEPSRRLAAETFRFDEALGPVLTMERALGTTIDADFDGLAASGDAEGLAQVVQNVLKNARLYAPASPVVIRARCVADVVQISIADMGAGIPERERITIFGRGARGSTSAGRQGSGIGLYVASRLMAEMGGSIRLGPRRNDTDTSEGACFVIELPGASASPTQTVGPGNSPSYVS